MPALDTFKIMALYNRWMNQRIYAVCAEIPDDERKRDRGAFFKSIHGTLNHLLLGDRAAIDPNASMGPSQRDGNHCAANI